MGCNGRIFEELPPDWNCHLRVGCNGLQWEKFEELHPPMTKIAMKEWAANSCNGRNFQELPPWLISPCKGAAMGCNGRNFQELAPWLILPCKSWLQWAAMGELLRNYLPDKNCHVRVGCNGLQWENFWGITTGLKLPFKSGLQWAAMGPQKLSFTLSRREHLHSIPNFSKLHSLCTNLQFFSLVPESNTPS